TEPEPLASASWDGRVSRPGSAPASGLRLGRSLLLGTAGRPPESGGLSMNRFSVGVASLTLLVCAAGRAAADGGTVLPSAAAPSGYSLEDLAAEMAYFTTSHNTPAFSPDTPFQVLSLNGTNPFTVTTSTRFFVPVAFIPASPPIIGDFPADAGDI